MSSSCAPTAVPAAPEDAPPEVEVVALSPPELLGCNGWYVCEACGRGFRRHQNLRQHRRRHVAPLIKREPERKRVFVCPEPGCRRHAASDALANLPSLKKHFRRKDGRHGLWACGRGRGSGAIAAGTSGHICDGCGRVFSHLESYVEHQGTCRPRPETSSSPPLPISQTLRADLASPWHADESRSGFLHGVFFRYAEGDIAAHVGADLASPRRADGSRSGVLRGGRALRELSSRADEHEGPVRPREKHASLQ